jgi:hypothetical protein
MDILFNKFFAVAMELSEQYSLFLFFYFSMILTPLIAGLEHAVSGLHCAGTVHAGTCKRTGMRNFNFLHKALNIRSHERQSCITAKYETVYK